MSHFVSIHNQKGQGLLTVEVDLMVILMGLENNTDGIRNVPSGTLP
jgi:hypothetical protein